MRRLTGLAAAFAGMVSAIFSISCATPKKASFYPLLFRSQQYLREGDFQKAIEICDTAYQKYPEAQPVLDNYLKTLQGVKKSADRFFEDEDYPPALRTYSVLLNNFPRFHKFETSLPFSREWLTARMRNGQNGIAVLRAGPALEAGEFNKGIEIYRARFLENPDDVDFLAAFVSILEDIKRTGDAALAKENFVGAGKAYFPLKKNFPAFEKFRTSLSFNEKNLDDGLKLCRTELNRKALEQYRKEDLAGAISTWQNILTFDPENLEVKKAIETATIQLNKIKK